MVWPSSLDFIQSNSPQARPSQSKNFFLLSPPSKIARARSSSPGSSSFVNQLHFDRVLIADPHSGVTPAMLDRCEELKLTFYLDNVIALENNIDYVFYPDAGALKRYSEILNVPYPVFYGNKKRDLNTGRIINYELVDAPDLLDKNILIIDDLCAKGGTFMMAGRKLKENGAKNVSLYVTHCEPSIFKGELLKTNVIDRIYTTKSLIRDDWCEKIIFVE